jgi:hypothetical protein
MSLTMTLRMRLRQYGRVHGESPWPKHQPDHRGIIPLNEKDKNRLRHLVEGKILFRLVKIVCDLIYILKLFSKFS